MEHEHYGQNSKYIIEYLQNTIKNHENRMNTLRIVQNTPHKYYEKCLILS